MLKQEVLAIIPARGGSKSIPKKNIKLLHGIPLIAYSIAAGLRAKLVDRVIVSTDDAEIAQIARDWGAETPFTRPTEISQDSTPDLPVFEHALKWLSEHEKYNPDIVVHLRPTSPIRPHGLVDDSIEILLKNPEADCVRGVVTAGQNPYKMWRLTDRGSMEPLIKVEGISEAYNAPRQTLPPVYWQTGHIDTIRAATILKKGSMSGEKIYPIIIDSRFTVDIDTESDWLQAEWLMDHLE